MKTKFFTLSTMSPANGWLAAGVRVEGSFRIANGVSLRNRHPRRGCFPMTD